ncbi:MAG: DNA polymerase III subunit chi [Betaproteobacteria bacterium]|nr:DNA polymerase III subunit chi [Betaproteobacteria bacterium]
MTSIDFYFNAEDRVQVACRLAAKALQQGKRLLVYAGDGESAARLDRTMWTWPAIGFVPHVLVHDPLAPQTPVLIAADAATLESPPVDVRLLLNVSNECPPHFERFERLLEVVGADEAGKSSGRERYRFYRDRGYPIANHDLAAPHG